MISIENFYWVLYENLLKPVKVYYWYYYPFGTTDYLVRSGYSDLKREHHVFFHFDQEPLYSNHFGKNHDEDPPVAWTSKQLRILANSERSALKKEICRDRDMLDWYFFYHGFAALDWYWDSQFVPDRKEITKVFLSFNHLVRARRSYRMSLLARLADRGVLDQGAISFHATSDDCLEEINDPNTKISPESQNLIEKNIPEFLSMPWHLDSKSINGTASAHFGDQEYKMWQDSFLHLVNETIFYEPKLHLTEKIFKPIVSLRPFILVAAPGNLEYLKSYGFKTFDRWWDESYDKIEDPDARLDAITDQISNLCKLSLNDLRDMLEEMQPVLEHNKKHFFTDFKKIIVDELVDNFDTCLRLWNNGRVDGREMPFHPDLDSVKRLLLR